MGPEPIKAVDDWGGDYRGRVAAGWRGDDLQPGTIVGLVVMIGLTSVALNSMMFLLMVRIEDPLCRARCLEF